MLGASVIAARVPRTYIDANRHAGDVDLELIEGAWPWEYQPSGKARLGKSLIWRTLDDIAHAPAADDDAAAAVGNQPASTASPP